MKFARFDVERPPGPDTVTLRAKLKGAQGFAKQVELLVLSASAPREALDRFLQGGARLAELADGNLLQVLEVGYEQGRAFLATEASAGEPLSKLLEQCKHRGLECLPAALAFGIGAELAKALAHAHAHVDDQNRPDPVTHGALRSDAVTVGEDGAVKLGGFVPWRAAPSPADDVEKLIELVGQWVSPSDQKLVKESAGGVTSAAQLRKAWSAYQALHWPQLAPDARRTLVAFARGEAPKQALESKLGARPAASPVPKWAFAVGAAAVVLVAVALAWPTADRAGPSEPVPLPRQQLPEKPGGPFSEQFEVDGAAHHLELPADLPSVSGFDGELWFEEQSEPKATAPQLFVAGKVDGDTAIGTVPRRWWHLAGARELRFFSWEPFELRYRPGLRRLMLAGNPSQLVPLVQAWLEVDAPGLSRHVPTGKQLTVTVLAAPDAGTPKAPLLVAASYGPKAPPSADPRWPFQLTRLALTAGQSSPTLDDAQELSFIAMEPADRFLVRVSEQSSPRDGLWPGARGEPEADPSIWNRGPRQLGGHYEGFEAPVTFGDCGEALLRLDCAHRCVASHPDNYYCWRMIAANRQVSSKEATEAAQRFLRLVEDKHPDHPFITWARSRADGGVTSAAPEEPAPPEPASPETR